MVRNDVQDELAEGFEPAALPPIAPDGGLELPPLREPPRVPPRLCEAGPCRNYHRFRIQLDAAKPLPVRGADGTFIEPEAPDHHEDHHYCYPSVGIESKLGSLPVIQCNRWSPISPREIERADDETEEWLSHTDAGRAFTAELEAYRTGQRELAKREQVAAEAADADLAAMPVAPIGVNVRMADAPHDVAAVLVTWEETIEQLIVRAIGPGQPGASAYQAHLDLPGTTHGRVLDPSHTISQAGLSAGDRLILTRKEIP